MPPPARCHAAAVIAAVYTPACQFAQALISPPLLRHFDTAAGCLILRR
jgi:hypothetical protein